MRVIGASLLILVVSACAGKSANNSSATPEGNAVEAKASGSNAQQAVRDLSDGQRNGVLFRAIRDARQPCQNVRESMLSETPGRTPVYMATCDNNAVYAVAIRDDGNAIVRAVMPAEENKQ